MNNDDIGLRGTATIPDVSPSGERIEAGDLVVWTAVGWEKWRPEITATVDPCAPKPEPAKLYCPAHGKMDIHDMNGGSKVFFVGDKQLCAQCVAAALERIGVHQLSDKPNQVTKKW